MLRKKAEAFDAMKKPQAPDNMKNIHCENYKER